MKDNPLSNWPPIIDSDHIPRWVKMRDIFLTIGAWLIILATFHSLIWIIFDYFSDPIFLLSTTATPQWSEIWQKVSRFFYIALGLVSWICFLAISRRKIINSTQYIKTFPSSVQMKELEADLGVSSADIERWHKLPSVEVFVNENNRVCKIIPSQKI